MPSLLRAESAAVAYEVDRRRLLQVQVESRLAASSAVYESQHFEIFYPFQRSLYFAERVAKILEAERERLRKWIPVSASGDKTQVFLLDFGDFQSYSGNVEILGLLDGKFRVPLAQGNTFVPLVVSTSLSSPYS